MGSFRTSSTGISWIPYPVIAGLSLLGVWIFSEERFVRALVMCAALGISLLSKSLLEARNKRPTSSMEAWRLFRMGIFALLCGAYFPGSVLLAARGWSLLLLDAVSAVAFVGLAAVTGLERFRWFRAAVFLALCASISAVGFLPQRPSLSGVDTREKGTDVLVRWSLEGCRVRVVPPLDSPVEIVNGNARVLTVEARRQQRNAENTGKLLGARAKGLSCLDLQQEMGAAQMIEALSWMSGDEGKVLDDLFECPAARREELTALLEDRMSARGEELAAKESLDSGDLQRASARARLALEICPEALWAKAVVAGVLLRRGIEGARVGRKTEAEYDLLRSLALLEEPEDRARGFLALGRVFASMGKDLEAKEAFETAVAEAPKHPASRAAQSRLAASL